MRRRFDEQLLELNQEMIAMGSRIEQAIENAGELMASRDVAAARIIMQGDQEIDRIEREIEGRCLRLLLMQQPVASDLRLISSALKNDHRHGTHWRSVIRHRRDYHHACGRESSAFSFTASANVQGNSQHGAPGRGRLCHQGH